MVVIELGRLHEDYESLYIHPVEQAVVAYPTASFRPVPDEVPEPIQQDYREASAVLPHSAKASAALSRRILQHVLREHFNIKPATLNAEIRTFIEERHVPSYLEEALDHVREIGNLAAHPSWDRDSGEILDVEPNDAKWLLDTLDLLFDFAYVKPSKLADMKAAQAERKARAGKSPRSNPPSDEG